MRRSYNTGTVEIALRDTLLDDVDTALKLHERMVSRHRRALRDRLYAERAARLAARQLQIINSHAVTSQALRNSRHGGDTHLDTGGAHEAMDWSHIEDKRDIDLRLKQYRRTMACDVIDVTAWARRYAAGERHVPLFAVDDLKNGEEANDPFGSVVASRRSRRQSVADSISSLRLPSPMSAAKAAVTAPLAPFSARPTILRRDSRLTTSSSVKVKASPASAREVRLVTDSQHASQSSLRPIAGRRREASPRRASKASVGFRGTALLPYLTNPITQRGIQQCELDFTMLSYGNAFIPFQAFVDHGPDYVFDYGSRRILAIEFMDYMKRHTLEYLSLVAFTHLVHPRWPRQEIAAAVRQWAPQLGWAVGLSPDLAECIHRLWVAANKGTSDDGRETISFDEFARLAKVEKNFALGYDDVRQMFYATDEDGNGILTKDEFACFIAGKVDVADVVPPEEVPSATAQQPAENCSSPSASFEELR